MSVEEEGRRRWMALDGAGPLPATRTGTTVYISIGNSDDGLTQQRWSRFIIAVAAEVASMGQLHGSWFSNPAGPWQNACWCVEFATEEQADEAKGVAAGIAAEYGQDSIAWAVAETEFIKPAST
jgi:hypothetical protein